MQGQKNKKGVLKYLTRGMILSSQLLILKVFTTWVTR